jgi:hypothetical protein
MMSNAFPLFPESGHCMNVHEYAPWFNRRGDTAGFVVWGRRSKG